ncbi:MAG: hypothetical protein AAGB93_09290 [Planctomycetota bacterium]
MRILSDFDGVWTDQADEARAIQRHYAHVAAPLVGLPPDEAEADFATFLVATLDRPEEHGWWPRGFLTAFVDEDELLATGAVSRWLDDGGEHPRADAWREGLRRGGYESVEAFGTVQFEPAMRAFRAARGHSLVDGARELCEALRARGDDLVVVSNSPTWKLAQMFAEAGVDEGEGVRFVGDARKWWIESPEPSREVHGRRVHLDRPFYRDVVADLDPDVVIGDVASLDLAIPAALRADGTIRSSTRLVLRRNERSSRWALEQTGLERDERLVDEVVDSVLDLAGATLSG